jgi:uncharacterized membrane protein SpoIIM required for sporulation
MKILNHPRLPFYLLIACCLLLCGIGISFYMNQSSTQSIDWHNSPLLTMTTLQLFQAIFMKNLIATFLIISLSIIGFRLIPAICIIFNGYMIGNAISALNYNSTIIFATIFPHGYVEFPLLLFSGACAFIIIEGLQETGLNAYTLLTRHGNPKVRYILKNYLIYPYIMIILPGVIIAAIIEATFSAWNLKILVGGL